MGGIYFSLLRRGKHIVRIVFSNCVNCSYENVSWLQAMLLNWWQGLEQKTSKWRLGNLKREHKHLGGNFLLQNNEHLGKSALPDQVVCYFFSQYEFSRRKISKSWVSFSKIKWPKYGWKYSICAPLGYFFFHVCST